MSHAPMIEPHLPVPDDTSEDSLALRLSAERLRGNYLYVPPWRSWMIWDGAKWYRDERLEHVTITREFLRSVAMSEDKDTTRNRLRSDSTVQSVINLARSNRDVAADVERWDADKTLLGTPGGTVDLKTGELRPALREDFITRHAAVTPADAQDCPLWFEFLERIFRTHTEIVPFLQRLAGYALTGYTTEHKLVFAFGSGRNGKTVFLNTLSGVMGDYATVAPSSTFLDSRNEGHPTDLAGLAGARLVTASELPPGKSWNESRLKSLTGGDPIAARRMRQDFFTFMPQFTLIISGNHMPSLKAVDHATRARMLMVPFAETIQPDEMNPHLAAQLRAEWPGILRWAIDGAREWADIGLAAPDVITNASRDYLDDEDELGQFTNECLTAAGADHFTPMKEVYEAFTDWQAQRGSRPWTQRALTTALIERGWPITRRATGRGIVGHALQNIPAPQMWGRYGY